MPVSIRERGIEPTEAQIKEMAEKCEAKFPGGIGTVRRLFAADAEKIFKAAM